MVKILFINALNGYRLDLPSALSCKCPCTQLWATRPLRTQLQSLLLLYDPKTRLDASTKTQLFIIISYIDQSLFTLRASLYLYNHMVCGPWVELSSRHYITKVRADNPMTQLQLHAPRPEIANSLHRT